MTDLERYLIEKLALKMQATTYGSLLPPPEPNHGPPHPTTRQQRRALERKSIKEGKTVYKP